MSKIRIECGITSKSSTAFKNNLKFLHNLKKLRLSCNLKKMN